MHTFEAHGVLIHHNSDGSGDALIRRLDDDSTEIRVPCAALLEFVANLIRNERIAVLEQAEPEVILGMPIRRPRK
jgi:hypothetical protein